MNPKEQHEVQKPNFEGEKMKMPENSAVMPVEATSHHFLSGPLLLVLALALVAILGGLYYWFMVLQAPTDTTPTPVAERPTPAENNEPESTTAEVQAESLQVLSTSNEIDAIEADLESTDLDTLDAELGTIDAELEATGNAE